MVTPILAFRPASVVGRLAPRSDACPLSLRDLLGPAGEAGLVLPVVRAPVAGVARAALLAAKVCRSPLGLALPPGLQPERWFTGVASAADELAAGLPIFLSAEVRVEGEGAMQVERAFQEAWRLVDAGITHLAIDVAAVAPGERGRVLAEVAAAGLERGICIDCPIPLDEGAPHARRAAALFEDLAGRGAPPDVASVRCREPRDAEEARGQVAALARICGALGGVPMLRRGPVTRALVLAMAGAPIRGCEDGGLAAAQLTGLVAPGALAPVDPDGSRQDPLEGAASRLGPEGLDRLEARVYGETVDFIEALGAAGKVQAVARALERRLEDR